MIIKNLVIQASPSSWSVFYCGRFENWQKKSNITLALYFNHQKIFKLITRNLEMLSLKVSCWVQLTNQQNDTFEKITALICRLQLRPDEVSHIS